MFTHPYTLNPNLENEPLVWLLSLLVLIILLQRWRGIYLRRDVREWKAAYYAKKKEYDDLPDADEDEDEDEEEALPVTDAELRGQVIGLTGKLEAANSLISHYKNNPDLYWKGKYEGLASESAEYRRASGRELFFLRTITNSDAAEGLNNWVDEDSDR